MICVFMIMYDHYRMDEEITIKIKRRTFCEDSLVNMLLNFYLHKQNIHWLHNHASTLI